MDHAAHYENLLSDVYTWIYGGFELNVAANESFFKSKNIMPLTNKAAIDLGCGSGFQSIALAKLGFNVTSIDSSNKLLQELKEFCSQNKIQNINTICSDLINFKSFCKDPVELIVCMGDTITHLNNFNDLKILINNCYNSLEPNGKFIITYRDMSFELKDMDRLIPVRQDNERLFLCFIEYENNEYARINDILINKSGVDWKINKSFYKKLRINSSYIVNLLEESKFKIISNEAEKGFVKIISQK